MNASAPVLLGAGYAAVLWAVAVALDAVGRRSERTPGAPRADAPALAGDVARFYRAIAGAVLGAGALLLVALALLQGDAAGLLLLPLSAGCVLGAVRRIAPLWREP